MSEPGDPSSQDPRPSRGWELACEGILRTEFGRRPSYALAHAMAQLAAEKHAAQTPVRWWLRIRQRSGFAFGVASVMVITLAGAAWFAWQTFESHRRERLRDLCTVLAAPDARWAAGSRQPKAGDVLAGGPLSLESGLVELEFANGAKVAIEGPARFDLTGVRSLTLRQGKVAAEVPRAARGFTVRTPIAKVVDLGTRFGVSADGETSSRVDVFDGKVRLTPEHDAAAPENVRELTRNMAMIVDQRGAATATPLPEGAYPQPERTVSVRPQNCGFDKEGFAVLGAVPVGFGTWSGPAYRLTTAIQGIRPPEGPGMLRFLDPPRRPGGAATNLDSEVWQLLDLRQHKELLAAGDVELKGFAWFNRVRGDARAPATFGFTLAAFRGSAAEAESLWKRRTEYAVALAEQEITTDDDPETWQKVELTTKLPPSADFLIVQIRAVRGDKAPGATPAFAGHFADWVDVYLNVPLRGSVAAGPP